MYSILSAFPIENDKVVEFKLEGGLLTLKIVTRDENIFDLQQNENILEEIIRKTKR